MANWRVAESLEVLRKQLNTAFPKRSKASDGGVGDSAHASRSTASDHNPHVQYKGQGIVTARDVTHDPATGCDGQWLADTLVKNRDPRIKYIIWNRQICSSKTSPWKWRPYSGVNAHTKHVHISVDASPKLFDSAKPWDLDFPDDETDDVAKISTVTATNPTNAGTPAKRDEHAVTAKNAVDQTDAPPTETTDIIQTAVGATVETTKNEQDVNEKVTQNGPLPYRGVGFWSSIKTDLAAATGGNISFEAISQYAQQASGWPEWVIAIVGKVAVGALIATFGYFIFRVVHYAVDSWKQAQRTRLLAEINTDITKKDLELS